MIQKIPCWLNHVVTDASAIFKRIIVLNKTQIIGIVLITFNTYRSSVLNNTADFTKAGNRSKSIFIFRFTPNAAVLAGKRKIMIIFFVEQRKVDAAYIGIAAVLPLRKTLVLVKLIEERFFKAWSNTMIL